MVGDQKKKRGSSRACLSAHGSKTSSQYVRARYDSGSWVVGRGPFERASVGGQAASTVLLVLERSNASGWTRRTAKVVMMYVGSHEGSSASLSAELVGSGLGRWHNTTQDPGDKQRMDIRERWANQSEEAEMGWS